MYVLDRFDVLMSKWFLKNKKNHWHAFRHEILFEKQPQPHCQTYSKKLEGWPVNQERKREENEKKKKKKEEVSSMKPEPLNPHVLNLCDGNTMANQTSLLKMMWPEGSSYIAPKGVEVAHLRHSPINFLKNKFYIYQNTKFLLANLIISIKTNWKGRKRP